MKPAGAVAAALRGATAVMAEPVAMAAAAGPVARAEMGVSVEWRAPDELEQSDACTSTLMATLEARVLEPGGKALVTTAYLEEEACSAEDVSLFVARVR